MNLRDATSRFTGRVALADLVGSPPPVRPVTTLAASCQAEGWTEWSDGTRTVIPKINCSGHPCLTHTRMEPT